MTNVMQAAEFTADMVAAVRRRVEAVSAITRRVKVNRALTPQQVLDETGCKQHVDPGVVEAMPQGEGDEVDVKFFKLDMKKYPNGYLTDEEATAELELHGLKPDPRAQAAVNRDDPAFTYTHPNGCNWQKDGKWYFAAFYHFYNEPSVDVYLSGVSNWDDNWWLGGVSK